jgi:hypothetical protein
MQICGAFRVTTVIVPMKTSQIKKVVHMAKQNTKEQEKVKVRITEADRDRLLLSNPLKNDELGLDCFGDIIKAEDTLEVMEVPSCRQNNSKFDYAGVKKFGVAKKKLAVGYIEVRFKNGGGVELLSCKDVQMRKL